MNIIRAILFLLCCSGSVMATQVEGRVVLNEKPLASMQVQAYSDLDPSGKPLGSIATTDTEGLFSLDLPPGFVALYARSKDGRYFAFCGRNPLQVGSLRVWAGLQAVEVTDPVFSVYDDQYTASLEGVVTFEGKPISDAFVSLYLDVADDLKGQGYRHSAGTGADGFFAFDGLPESNYFLVVRKRQNLEPVGPLVDGDFMGVYAGNPISLKSGRTAVVTLPMVERKSGSRKGALPDRPGPIKLAGRIVDISGKPLANLHFFAYRDPVIGHQRPDVLSAQTGADGQFEVSFREPGIYYVGAREAYGDSPAPGELFGLYSGRADHGLQIVVGNNDPVVIQATPIRLD
ncbi:MSCRAMM family protein [Geopsychrobacter electrodiphilus]|uniref:MSCRAMM family protein n=1 Tax=Geopsychrobacter electrodiphilus TaxID=225196 RepID=UPI00039FE431|nr:carboxypeptidase-like regulatory domain-containing protein [Geopsychrobacter electrodiphilus]